MARLLGSDAEPVEVLRRAEEHRQYWRPDRVKVVLLAESHVFTTIEELARAIELPSSAPPGLPRGFVRLVYCLGYGENHLLDRPIEFPRNGGTPQFWKIFYSCANAVSSNGDFAPIQTTMTTPANRVANKIALLEELRDLGVWLLDTSPAALYFPRGPKPGRAVLDACLQVGWDYHVRQVIEGAAPSHVVCVGRGVARALGSRLSSVGARVTVVPQPNARLSSADHHQTYLTYHRVTREAFGLA
jgi:hypothetical protein